MRSQADSDPSDGFNNFYIFKGLIQHLTLKNKSNQIFIAAPS